VRETKRELAVIGEQQQAGCIGIEPSDWEQSVTGLPLISDHIENCRARLLVTGGGDHSERLVDDHVTVPGHRPYRVAVDCDHVFVGVDEHTGGRRDLAVHAHRP
jgi:hypothetical protein